MIIGIFFALVFLALIYAAVTILTGAVQAQAKRASEVRMNGKVIDLSKREYHRNG